MSIWVSKVASEHQECSQIAQKLHNFYLNCQKHTLLPLIVFLCIFGNFLCKKSYARGRPSHAARGVKFFLVSLLVYWNGKMLEAHSN